MIQVFSLCRLRLKGRNNRIFWTIWSTSFLAFLFMYGADATSPQRVLGFSLLIVAALLGLAIRVHGIKADRRKLIELHGKVNPDIAAFLNGEITLANYQMRQAFKASQNEAHKVTDLTTEPSADSEKDSAALWTMAYAIIRWHNRGQDDCIETLNRLWRSGPWIQDPSVLPMITTTGMHLTLQHWNLKQLTELLHPTQKTSKVPRSTAPPIIVIRWLDKDFLIDGRTRINFWKKNNDNGPHRVIVIHVTN